MEKKRSVDGGKLIDHQNAGRLKKMAIDRQLLFELSHFLMIDFPSIPFHRALHLPFDDISFACPPSNEMNDFLRFRDPKNWQRRIVQCESRF